MIPKLHPLSKTSIELRRAILRLEGMAETNPKEFVDAGAPIILELLKNARNKIREEYKDPDLTEV